MEKWIPAYFSTLEKQIVLAVRDEQEKPRIHTIFFGGGTPSFVPASEYKKLLKVVRSSFELTENIEMSLEANPGTLRERDLSEYKRIGINRISLGVQSFHQDELKLLGRIHDSQDIWNAVQAIRQAGFSNLNLDLIYGLPGQSISRWKESLERALDLKPEHLSLYCLTIEEGTPLEASVKRGEVVPLNDDDSAEMYELAMQMLERAEYRHYEISNWAKKSSGNEDFRCRHNLQYWRNQEYYGFGAGAHGYIRSVRVANYSKIPQYIAHASNSNDIYASYRESNETELKERMQDELMLGLRLVDEGVSATSFRSKFGFEMLEVFSGEISRLIGQHLINWSDGERSSIILTERGILLGNQVFMEFVGD